MNAPTFFFFFLTLLFGGMNTPNLIIKYLKVTSNGKMGISSIQKIKQKIKMKISSESRRVNSKKRMILLCNFTVYDSSKYVLYYSLWKKNVTYKKFVGKRSNLEKTRKTFKEKGLIDELVLLLQLLSTPKLQIWTCQNLL